MGNRMMKYYTYIHSSPDGDIFYVGKGNGRRVYSMRDRSWLWRERFNSYDGITMKIVKKFYTEKEAFDHEKELIKFYKDKGFNLVNLTEGGSGANGYIQAPELRAKKSVQMRGYKHAIVSCPHCGDVGGETSMKRWHFDNCIGPTKKFKARVSIDGKRIYLGKFLTKEEAKSAESDYYCNNRKTKDFCFSTKHTYEPDQIASVV